MRPLNPTEAKRLAREWRRRTDGRVALLLDNVQNPFNVGSIARTAAALRVEHLYLVGTTPPPNHPSARKTGLGTERYLTWSEHGSAPEAAAAAKEAGFTVVGLELTANAVPIQSADFGGDVCLAIGHEDRGLSSVALAACASVAYVPLLGKVGSLNVAAATSIALYEVRRQHWELGSGGDGVEGDADPVSDG
ncbi:MAG: TrmH family RNA methyltransferase [Acidimicrobiia bacterium]